MEPHLAQNIVRHVRYVLPRCVDGVTICAVLRLERVEDRLVTSTLQQQHLQAVAGSAARVSIVAAALTGGGGGRVA